MEYYKLTIDETSRNSLRDEPRMFNRETKCFDDMNQVKAELVNRYGKMPSMRNKLYRDKSDGEADEVGFTHSFWNRDISHNSKPWYQTDWVTITKVNETPILLTA